MTMLEQVLVEEYERARRAYGECRHAALGCVMTADEAMELLSLQIDLLDAEGSLRDHVAEWGEVETGAGIYAIGGDGELAYRRLGAPSPYTLAERGPSWN